MDAGRLALAEDPERDGHTYVYMNRECVLGDGRRSSATDHHHGSLLSRADPRPFDPAKRSGRDFAGLSHPTRPLPAPRAHDEKLGTTRRILEKIPGQSVPYISRKSENRGNTITANIWAQDSVVPTTTQYKDLSIRQQLIRSSMAHRQKILNPVTVRLLDSLNTLLDAGREGECARPRDSV